jgi:hypothetical protein
MADNVAITPGSGATVATDDVGGFHYQRIKVAVGADGVAADWPVGSGTAAAVPRITLATDSPGIITTGTAGSPATQVLTVQGITSGTVLPMSNTPLTDFGAGEYAYVAASATSQILGTGAVGDYLSHLLIVPETSTPGAVSLTDGNGTARVIFVGGASSVSNLVPFTVMIGAKATNATTPGWKVTTTTNVHVLGFGNFT